MSNGSLIDPSLELADPCPDIYALFLKFNTRFFGGALACCEVKWSPRMYSCAGICSYEVRGGRGGLCSIRLSLPLLKLRPRKDLVETLLHEMIHAYLFVKERNRDRDGHGPQFQAHMHRINSESGTNITIYHSFHTEVALYKQHWWRCDGVCKDRRPFFGYVKRSSNRAPGPNDLWWSRHQQSCGGKFIKIKEPDGYGQKKRKVKSDDKPKVPAKKVATPPKLTLDDYYIRVGGPSENKKKNPTTTTGKAGNDKIVPFSGSGQRLGGAISSPVKPFSGKGQRLGGAEDNKPAKAKSKSTKTVEIITLDDSDDDDNISNVPSTSSSSNSTNSTTNSRHGNRNTNRHWSEDIPIGDFDFGDDDDDLEMSFIAPTTTNFTMIICPSCNEQVLEERLNDHLDHCAG